MTATKARSFEATDDIPMHTFQADLKEICGLFDVDPATRASTVSGAVSVRLLGRLDMAEVAPDAQKISRH